MFPRPRRTVGNDGDRALGGDLPAQWMVERPRPRKDPGDLRVLAPAWGPGHFLPYSFDLLLAIYEEASALNAFRMTISRGRIGHIVDCERTGSYRHGRSGESGQKTRRIWHRTLRPDRGPWSSFPSFRPGRIDEDRRPRFPSPRQDDHAQKDPRPSVAARRGRRMARRDRRRARHQFWPIRPAGPATRIMPNAAFMWPSVVMIMAPTPMKSEFPDAGACRIWNSAGIGPIACPMLQRF